jgi:nucleoside-diphosphate-sugar epimerase
MSLDDGRVFADFVADIVNNRDIVMKSDGGATRSFCYLADAVTGFFTVLLRGEAGQAYNVGNDQGELSILELANMLVALFLDKGLQVIRDEQAVATGYLRSNVTRHRPDISKVKQLGWQPTTPPATGFARTIRSFT